MRQNNKNFEGNKIYAYNHQKKILSKCNKTEQMKNLVQNSNFQQQDALQKNSKFYSNYAPEWTCKCQKFKLITEQIIQLRQRNAQLREQIQFLLTNFQYILVLVQENIQETVRSKIKNICIQKDKTIEKLQKINHRLQEQNDMLVDKIDINTDYLERTKELEKKLAETQSQNFKLKNDNINYLKTINIRQMLIKQDEVNENENVTESMCQKRLNSSDQGTQISSNAQSIKKLESRNTCEQNQQDLMPRISSLRCLRQKIIKIKQKIIRQSN